MDEKSINEESLAEMLMEDPEKLFALLDAAGADYEDLKELKLGKLFATKRFPDLIENEHDGAAEFMFWISYWIEREVGDDITFIEQRTGRATQIEIEQKLDGMSFGNKIQFLVDRKYTNDDDTYIIFLKDMRALRSHLSHGRLHKLGYGGHPLWHPKGQMKLISDFRKVLLHRERNSP